MRILYNSKDPKHKLPFGTLTEGQKCNISISIPKSCQTTEVKLVLLCEDKTPAAEVFLQKAGEEGPYEHYSCEFALSTPDLYFYYFRITTKNESFALYREGYDRTNMEAGELWQLSCIPADFHVPEDFRGAVMYQIFPDRFHSVGKCDLAGKLQPFFVHEDKQDTPCYLPDERGEVLNCDFFGGNLRGIEKKLNYLRKMGVRVIYLNPIFKAWSNHRYDTADYLKIDEMLGTEADFRRLCRAAHKRGMKIILDGVFSHTGSNSRYFDKENVFGGGAYHDPTSPYRSWFEFKDYPQDYTSWWGIQTLPCVREMDEGYLDFIINAEDSVVAHWLRAGADGFRLDVADELPDAFIAALRKRLKEVKPDALLIGEVWEDASNKISYNARRRYFTAGELDAVMNYPFRLAIIDYVTGKDEGRGLAECVMTIAENYPEGVLHTLMNMLSTHDTPRILSLLSPEQPPEQKEQRATFRMSETAMETALLRLRAATFLQFVLPGMPCIYYGDEIGTEGFGDPFCRSYFDWQRTKNNPLVHFFASLAALRKTEGALLGGDVLVESPASGVICVKRTLGDTVLCATVNMSHEAYTQEAGKVLFGERFAQKDGNATLEHGGFVLQKIN